jgi:hypothetical protein
MRQAPGLGIRSATSSGLQSLDEALRLIPLLLRLGFEHALLWFEEKHSGFQMG